MRGKVLLNAIQIPRKSSAVRSTSPRKPKKALVKSHLVKRNARNKEERYQRAKS